MAINKNTSSRPYTTQKEHLASMEERITMQMQMLEKFADAQEDLMQRMGKMEQIQGSSSVQLDKLEVLTASIAKNIAVVADAVNGNAEMKRKGIYEELQDVKQRITGLETARAAAAAVLALVTGLALAFKDTLLAQLH